MALRVGFDLDGVLADFRSAFEAAAGEVGVRVSDEEATVSALDPLSSQEIKRIWDHVKRTPNWWVHLAPCEPDQIPRLHDLARRLKWEVVFVTRRPATAGDPVQLQTQQWLAHHGFTYPAVMTVPGSRGELANALRLDLVVDDQLMNCIDIVSGSTAKTLLLLRDEADAPARDQAVSRGIGVVASLREALDVAEHLHDPAHERRGRLRRLTDWFSGGGATPAAPGPREK